MEVEAHPIDVVVLDTVQFFKKNGGDVGEVANEVRFVLNNRFGRSHCCRPKCV